jgi:hypothetical protein
MRQGKLELLDITTLKSVDNPFIKENFD